MSHFYPRFPLSMMNASFDPRDGSRREGRAGGAASDPRPPVSPLSPEEQAIWDAHEAELSGHHHRIFVARIRGRLEGERLELALERIVDRHEELRATFHETAGGALRRLRASTEFHLEFVDARRWSEGELEEIVRLTSRQPIDLTASPFRAVLFTRDEADHSLLLVAHRIAVGARRLRQILNDLRSLYDGEDLPLLSADPIEAARPGLSTTLASTLLLSARSVTEPIDEPEEGLHRSFERVAALAPERTALSDGRRSVSYGELDMAANRLARRLRDAGVDPRSRVAIDLPLSPEAVAAHLAVLKLGAVSLPCASFATDGRAGALLRAAAPAALVTLAGRHSSEAPLPPIVIALDEEAAALTALSSQPLGVTVPAEQTALVALRSCGDSFRAIPLTHAAVASLLTSLRGITRLTSDQRTLAIGSLGACELVLEILLPISAGATIVIDDHADAAGPARLGETLVRESIALTYLAPEVWGDLVRSGWRCERGLQILCDARGLSPDLAALSAGVAELRTMYGHLETTLCCASASVGDGGRFVVGEPVGGSTLHLLDDELCPVPVGEVGTIYVGGPGVVRGYLGKPAGDPAAFLPDPFSPDGRGLLFRTNDRARRGADGSLRLVGGET